ncbi:MAG: hypothetical protein L6R40_007233 [Gallowayella cf. fulva]|nr:MAG: hypothetical protein L6R40_007233 [Xanthomendoza cf. fulva]
MPHNHRRPKTSSSFSSHDLPPTTLAHPLPVSKSHQPPKPHKRKPDRKDDTPRAFARLINYATTGRKTPRGLDDGITIKPSRKRKRGHDGDIDAAAPETAHQGATLTATTTITTTEIPRILPGERMGDFSARVDRAFPVSAGLVGKKGVGGRQTRTEKRMQRMQREWRVVEARRKEKLLDAQEEEEEAQAEEDGAGGGLRVGIMGRGKKGGKKRKMVGEGSDDEDLWAVVAANRKREQEEREKREGRGGLVGLHDVVLAPPKFTKVPKKKKVDGADVVRKGGLKRQVELSEERRSVVEGYRRMMKEKREGVTAGEG